MPSDKELQNEIDQLKKIMPSDKELQNEIDQLKKRVEALEKKKEE